MAAAGARYIARSFPYRYTHLDSGLKSRNGVIVAAGQAMGTSGSVSLRFDNLALRSLPLDPSDECGSRQVPGACFSRVRPAPVERPRLVACSLPALGLLEPDLEVSEQELAEYFSGNRELPGSEPAAHCYCGHQFGNFAGQLGDGAAMYLGEVVNVKGQRWELQIKGAGSTPYSRQSDGRKVLRSSIREFLCSEAMFHLGIPTTRGGTCVTSDSKVIRDVLYDGHPKYEKCTIVLRIASTFLRFGSFEIFKPMDEHTGRKGPSCGRNDIRIQMLDYVIGTFYPEIQSAHSQNKVQRNAAFFREITKRTARLVADWQCVGFCHGVLNTDNMSIVGLTIDYGPFGFMDRFDPDYICNGSDNRGRYAYNQQPEICKWNLSKLAEALVPELPLEESQSIIEEEYNAEFKQHYQQKMRKKLGLLRCEKAEDEELVSELLHVFQITGADFTNTFRLLSEFPFPGISTFFTLAEFLEKLIEQCASLEELKLAFAPSMDPRQLSMLLALSQSSPQLFDLLGNKEGIAKELDRIEHFSELQKMTTEELLSKHKKAWTDWLQKYSSRLENEAEGVDDIAELNTERVKVMNSNNPKFILRNYIAQNAITAAENGDFSEILQRCQKPGFEQVISISQKLICTIFCPP
ncbi:selenoprotein O1 isoform X3 [Heterodontus francisci]|uniref:selenoprotein O1 isoform X3 n=1 Tax=Heterodontus francisci TaxID=7792 RepID=UPI00355BE009